MTDYDRFGFGGMPTPDAPRTEAPDHPFVAGTVPTDVDDTDYRERCHHPDGRRGLICGRTESEHAPRTEAPDLRAALEFIADWAADSAEADDDEFYGFVQVEAMARAALSATPAPERLDEHAEDCASRFVYACSCPVGRESGS